MDDKEYILKKRDAQNEFQSVQETSKKNLEKKITEGEIYMYIIFPILFVSLLLFIIKRRLKSKKERVDFLKEITKTNHSD